MAKLVVGMNMSLDGYVDHDRFEPGPALFQHFTEQTRSLAGSIYGRGLYELMQYWDADDFELHAGADLEPLRAFADAWRRQPKWVVSRSLESVGPNATLLRENFAEDIRRIKSEVEGRIDVGGPVLAASLAKLGLIDEYQIYLRPYVLGKGRPYFTEAQPPLRLISNERVGEDAICLTYAPA